MSSPYDNGTHYTQQRERRTGLIVSLPFGRISFPALQPLQLFR